MIGTFLHLRFLQAQHKQLWTELNPCLMRLMPQGTNQIEMATYCLFFICLTYRGFQRDQRKFNIVVTSLNNTLTDATVDALDRLRPALPQGFPDRHGLLDAMRLAVETRPPLYAQDMASGDRKTLGPWLAAARRHLGFQAQSCSLPYEREACGQQLAEATKAAVGHVVAAAAQRFS